MTDFLVGEAIVAVLLAIVCMAMWLASGGPSR